MGAGRGGEGAGEGRSADALTSLPRCVSLRVLFSRHSTVRYSCFRRFLAVRWRENISAGSNVCASCNLFNMLFGSLSLCVLLSLLCSLQQRVTVIETESRRKEQNWTMRERAIAKQTAAVTATRHRCVKYLKKKKKSPASVSPGS